MKIFFSICIITPGKYCTIKAGAIPKLLAMLNNESSELIVNALKVKLYFIIHMIKENISFRLFHV